MNLNGNHNAIKIGGSMSVVYEQKVQFYGGRFDGLQERDTGEKVRVIRDLIKEER